MALFCVCVVVTHSFRTSTDEIADMVPVAGGVIISTVAGEQYSDNRLQNYCIRNGKELWRTTLEESPRGMSVVTLDRKPCLALLNP